MVRRNNSTKTKKHCELKIENLDRGNEQNRDSQNKSKNAKPTTLSIHGNSVEVFNFLMWCCLGQSTRIELQAKG